MSAVQVSEKTEKFVPAAEMFKALGHPSRLLVVDELSKRKLCVGDLAELAGCDISTMSAHLAALKYSGVISMEKEGRKAFYKLCCPCLAEIFTCMIKKKGRQ